MEREVERKNNHTWTPAGWTPTTTSSRFQLVSQVACLDANSGCFRWGDRSSAFQRHLPSFAPVIVVVDLAAPSLRVSRSLPLFRSPSYHSTLRSVLPLALFHTHAPSPSFLLTLCRLFPASPILAPPLTHLPFVPPSLFHATRSLHCLHSPNAPRMFPFCLEVASRLLTPNWVFPMRQRHARSVGWRSPPA